MHMQSSALKRQEQINKVSAQLHTLNFLFNYANSSRYRNLNDQYQLIRQDIRQGQSIVMRMQDSLKSQAESVEHLEANVLQLSETVDEQGRLYVDLHHEVAVQKKELAEAIDDYDRRLREQEQLIAQQEETLRAMQQHRFRTDFGVDCFIVTLAYFASHSRVLRFFLGLFSSAVSRLSMMRTKSSQNPLIFKQHKQRVASRTRMLVAGSQLIAWAGLVRYLRLLAVMNGVHSLIGSVEGYAGTLRILAAESLQEKAPSLVSLGGAVAPLLSTAWSKTAAVVQW